MAKTQPLPACFTHSDLINRTSDFNPDDCLNIWAAPSPFAAARKKFTAPSGMSVGHMVAHIGVDVTQFVDARVDIDGEPVEKEAWFITFPQPGSLINIRAVPQGGGGSGGKSPLRTILTIAVFAAAAWAASIAATNLALTPTGIFGPATAGQIAISSGLIKAGVGAVGSPFTNAITPIQGVQL